MSDILWRPGADIAKRARLTHFLELLGRKLLLGRPADEVINRDTMSNPDSVNFFVGFAGRLRG